MSGSPISANSFPDFLFTAQPENIEDVVNMLEAISDALPETDGLYWWNRLYLITTQELHARTRWENPAWITCLDVNFAKRYFESLKELYSGQRVQTVAWRQLFRARQRRHIDHIQFAMAGMVAHIAFDLAQALISTNDQLGITPGIDSAEWRDYQKVNEAFKVLIPQALSYLDSGIWGAAANVTGLPGRLLAQFNIKEARELAWDLAEHLRVLSKSHPRQARLAIGAENTAVGLTARAMLLPLDPASRLSRLSVFSLLKDGWRIGAKLIGVSTRGPSRQCR